MSRSPKPKFKIGDKVRILPSAVYISVANSEVGKIGEILKMCGSEHIIISTATERYAPWVVRECDIELVIKVGRQLIFSFMEEG